MEVFTNQAALDLSWLALGLLAFAGYKLMPSIIR